MVCPNVHILLLLSLVGKCPSARCVFLGQRRDCECNSASTSPLEQMSLLLCKVVSEVGSHVCRMRAGCVPGVCRVRAGCVPGACRMCAGVVLRETVMEAQLRNRLLSRCTA